MSGSWWGSLGVGEGIRSLVGVCQEVKRLGCQEVGGGVRRLVESQGLVGVSGGWCGCQDAGGDV